MISNLQKEIIKAGSEFLNITEDEFKSRMENNTERGVEDWKKYGIGEYDKRTEANIYGLCAFYTSLRLTNLLHPIRFLKPSKILDFGGGIGVISRLLELQGHEVYYYDVPSKTQDFAKFMAEKSESKVNFLTKEELETHKFDIIITADVLEHLQNPMEYVKKLDKLLVNGGIWLTTGLVFSVGEHTPMHLPENAQYRDEHDRFFSDNYNNVFFHVTPQEIVFLFVKKKPE